VKARKGGRKGFTLLEIVVAVTILGAGIVLVFGLLSGTLRLAAGVRDASESSIYAGQRLEEALLVPYPVEGKEHGEFGEKYRWELTTTIIPRQEERKGEAQEEEEANAAYDEVRLRVTVRWEDAGVERSVEVGASRWIRREADEGA